jgi:hypothetical protein
LPGNLVTFRVLEPYAVKVASTVLRRERRGNPPDLSDQLLTFDNLLKSKLKQKSIGLTLTKSAILLQQVT